MSKKLNAEFEEKAKLAAEIAPVFADIKLAMQIHANILTYYEDTLDYLKEAIEFSKPPSNALPWHERSYKDAKEKRQEFYQTFKEHEDSLKTKIPKSLISLQFRIEFLETNLLNNKADNITSALTEQLQAISAEATTISENLSEIDQQLAPLGQKAYKSAKSAVETQERKLARDLKNEENDRQDNRMLDLASSMRRSVSRLRTPPSKPILFEHRHQSLLSSSRVRVILPGRDYP